MSCTRMTTLDFLLLALSPFVMSDSDYPLISCPLCKSKTLWNIFMILGIFDGTWQNLVEM